MTPTIYLALGLLVLAAVVWLHGLWRKEQEDRHQRSLSRSYRRGSGGES